MKEPIGLHLSRGKHACWEVSAPLCDSQALTRTQRRSSIRAQSSDDACGSSKNSRQAPPSVSRNESAMRGERFMWVNISFWTGEHLSLVFCGARLSPAKQNTGSMLSLLVVPKQIASFVNRRAEINWLWGLHWKYTPAQHWHNFASAFNRNQTLGSSYFWRRLL